MNRECKTGRGGQEPSLGTKIKEARIAKQLTQSELVGDFITRNMLSKIENDAAAPSLKTLEYLSARLDVPLSYFMSSMVAEPEKMLPDYSSYSNQEIGQFADRLTRFIETGSSDRNELRSILSGFEAAADEPSAESIFCEKAAQYYMERDMEEALPYLLFLKARCLISSGKNTWKAALYGGLVYLCQKDYVSAELLLLQASEECPDKKTACYIYSALEKCSVARDDYKSAYRYSHLKQAIGYTSAEKDIPKSGN